MHSCLSQRDLPALPARPHCAAGLTLAVASRKRPRTEAVQELTGEEKVALAVARAFIVQRGEATTGQKVATLARIQAFCWADLLVRV